MDGITHILVGRLLASAFPASPALGWVATLFAVLPDFDTITWVVKPLRRYLRHRGLTHTLPFGVGASLVAGVVCALAGWAPFVPTVLVAMLGWASHVTLDVLNWGAPVLAPWRRAPLEWTIHGGFAWSAALSVGSLATLFALHLRAPAWEAPVSWAMGAAFVAYLAFRAAMKLRAMRRHPGERVIPTGNPLVWAVMGSEA